MSRLDQLKQDVPHPEYYKESFRVTLESCIDLINAQQATTTVEVDPHHARIYEGDFYTYLLTTVRIPKEIHWVILRINGMLSPTDFTREIKTLRIPSQQFIGNIQTSVASVQVLDDY